MSGPKVAQAQIAAFRAWERVEGERFAELRRITQPCLVVNGMLDTMIPVRNSYLLAEHLPNAMLLIYPDAGMARSSSFPTPSCGRRRCSWTRERLAAWCSSPDRCGSWPPGAVAQGPARPTHCTG